LSPIFSPKAEVIAEFDPKRRILATAKRITVDKDNTTIIDGGGDRKTLEGRVKQIRAQIEETVTEAGLHIKLPFVQEVRLFEKRLLSWDGDPNQIPTKGREFIWVDTTARWRIVDAKKFLENVATEAGVQSRLDDFRAQTHRRTVPVRGRRAECGDSRDDVERTAPDPLHRLSSSTGDPGQGRCGGDPDLR